MQHCLNLIICLLGLLCNPSLSFAAEAKADETPFGQNEIAREIEGTGEGEFAQKSALSPLGIIRPLPPPIFDPNFPLKIEENKIWAIELDDETALELAYRDLLAKVRDYLAAQNVTTEITTDYSYSKLGKSKLVVTPLPHATFDLNRLAFELAKHDTILEYQSYISLRRLRNTKDTDRHFGLRSAPHKWFFNSNTLQNLTHLINSGILKYRLEKMQSEQLDPFVENILTGLLYGYRHYDLLTMQYGHALPYFALELDVQQKIYIPYRKHVLKTIKNDTTVALGWSNYRIARKLGGFAQSILGQYQREGIFPEQKLAILEKSFHGIYSNVALGMIDLNALLYCLIERPSTVRFSSNKMHSDKMMVFINPQTTPPLNSFAYVLNLPWPRTILSHGDTAPLFTSPEFQIFYRHHLDVFHRMYKIRMLHAAAAQQKTPEAITAWLQALIKFGQRSPDLIKAMVDQHPWDAAQLRYFREKAQKRAIEEMSEFRYRHILYLWNNNDFYRGNCAKNVLPPPTPKN